MHHGNCGTDTAMYMREVHPNSMSDNVKKRDSALAGGCNFCHRCINIVSPYTVYEITFEHYTFRACEKCKKRVASRLLDLAVKLSLMIAASLCLAATNAPPEFPGLMPPVIYNQPFAAGHHYATDPVTVTNIVFPSWKYPANATNVWWDLQRGLPWVTIRSNIGYGLPTTNSLQLTITNPIAGNAVFRLIGHTNWPSKW